MKFMPKIVIIVLFSVIFGLGCIEYYEVESTPTSVIEQFATSHNEGNFDTGYSLMSAGYKKTHEFSSFETDMGQCSSGWKKYEFIGVVNSNDSIMNDTATLVISYRTHKTDDKISNFFVDEFDKLRGKDNMFEKQIELIKEDGSWKLDNLHCELKKG